MIVARDRVMEAYWSVFEGDQGQAIEKAAQLLCVAPEAVADVVANDQVAFADAMSTHLQRLQEA